MNKQITGIAIAILALLAVAATISNSTPFTGNLSCEDLGYPYEAKLEESEVSIGTFVLEDGLIIEITEVLHEKPDSPDEITGVSFVVPDSSVNVLAAIWKAGPGGHYIIGNPLTAGLLAYNEHGSNAALSHLSFCHGGPTAIGVSNFKVSATMVGAFIAGLLVGLLLIASFRAWRGK